MKYLEKAVKFLNRIDCFFRGWKEQIFMNKLKKEHYKFEGWIELPYFVGIKYSEEINLDIPGRKPIKTDVEFRNDLLKIWTGNEFDYWSESKEGKTHTKEITEDQLLRHSFFPLYKARDEIKEFKKEASKDNNIRYFHIEIPETIVSIKASIPDPFIEYVGSIPIALLPLLSKIIDAYRIAAIPSMRYEIHPLSEANVNSMRYIVRDYNNNIIQSSYLGFDTKAHSEPLFFSYGKKYKVQDRFDNALCNITDLELENQMSVAYNLLHMRRWVEAVVIASAVVDELIKQLIYKRAKEGLADLVWKKCRNSHKEIFNKVFPALNIEKLSTTNSKLWQLFCEAKEFRGRFAHSVLIDKFEKEVERETLQHVNTLISVAEWLSEKIGREWYLSIVAPDKGKALKPIP